MPPFAPQSISRSRPQPQPPSPYTIVYIMVNMAVDITVNMAANITVNRAADIKVNIAPYLHKSHRRYHGQYGCRYLSQYVPFRLSAPGHSCCITVHESSKPLVMIFEPSSISNYVLHLQTVLTLGWLQHRLLVLEYQVTI